MKIFQKKSYWCWIVFLSQTYIVAVPIALLLCQFFALNKPDTHNASYWDLHLQARIISGENAKIISFIEQGYFACLAVLALETASAKDKKRIRAAIVFAMLAIVSMIILYLNNLIAP